MGQRRRPDRGGPGPVAGVPGQYYLIYFGHARPLHCELPLPAGDYRADVIDTWNMTIESATVTNDGRFLRVDLGGREHIALRLTALAGT